MFLNYAPLMIGKLQGVIMRQKDPKTKSENDSVKSYRR